MTIKILQHHIAVDDGRLFHFAIGGPPRGGDELHQQGRQVLEDHRPEGLPEGVGCEGRLVLLHGEHASVFQLVAFCLVPAAHVDAPAFGTAVFAGPVVVAEVVECVVEVLEIFFEDAFRGS